MPPVLLLSGCERAPCPRQRSKNCCKRRGARDIPDMPKFILATLGTGGDLYPIIHLGKELLACGHEVTVISNLHFEGIVKSHGFAFAPLYLDKQAADNYQIFESIYRYITDERCHSANTVMVSNQNLFVMCQTIAEVTRIPYGVMFMAPYFLSRISA